MWPPPVPPPPLSVPNAVITSAIIARALSIVLDTFTVPLVESKTT